MDRSHSCLRFRWGRRHVAKLKRHFVERLRSYLWKDPQTHAPADLHNPAVVTQRGGRQDRGEAARQSKVERPLRLVDVPLERMDREIFLALPCRVPENR